MAKHKVSRVLDFIKSEQWAITPDYLENIYTIAGRMNEDPRLIELQRGAPLHNTRNVTVQNGVAVIPVVGPIFRYGNMFTEVSGATSLDTLAKDFKQALDSDEVKSIVLSIDSPGGMAAGIAEFAGVINESNKPTVAYVDDKGCSAAYWIASACDQLFISKTASVGSVGAILSVAPGDDDGALTFVSSVSPKKRLDPMTEDGQAVLQATVDKLGRIFVEDVANFRGITADTVIKDFGQGGTKMGNDAVAAGMADGVTSLDALLKELSTTQTKEKPGYIMTTKTYKANELTREVLAAECPELLKSIEETAASVALSEKSESLRAEGALKERERIQGVQGCLIPGYEKEISAMMFDGVSTEATAALAIIKAEKAGGERFAANLEAGSLEPVPHAAAETDEHKPGKVDNYDHLPDDEKFKAIWDSSPELRTEFDSDYEAYAAFAAADAEGLVKLRQHTATK